MEIRNPWTSYLTRSYEQIKLAIVKRLTVIVPEMKDYSQTNLFMVITDIFAGVAEMLNYYIDAISKELFPTTALRLSSLIKVAKQQGYWGTAAIPASNDLTLELLDTSDTIIQATQKINIPMGTEFTDIAGNTWTSIAPAVMLVGRSSTIVKAKQYESLQPFHIATSDGTPFQKFMLGIDYADGSIALTISGTPWELVDSLGLYPGTAEVFQIFLEEDGSMYILFGDNVNGKIPAASSSIDATIQSTMGDKGNVSANSINIIKTSITVPINTHLNVYNSMGSRDGRGIDNVFTLARTIPRAAYTLDRAITRKDFEYVAEMAPGVRDAKVASVCGGELTIHVAPFTTAIATAAQLQSTKEYIEARANLTVGDILVKSAGETAMHLELNVKSYPNAVHSSILTALQDRLLAYYYVDTSEINGAIKLSDIYAIADTTNNIDYVDIVSLYTEPYIRSVGADVLLEYSFVIDSNYTGNISYKLTYDSVNDKFHLFVGSTAITSITPNNPTLIEPGVTLTITRDLTIPNNTIWLFTTRPSGTNLFLDDGTLPVLYYENLQINFI